ncbi:MAG: hypothetical protein Q8J80_12780 [Gallionella sp.]|nr:hypothetical protein [Gallionella sp.]
MMDHWLRLNIYTRLAIALCLSLCIHLAILLISASPSSRAGLLPGIRSNAPPLAVLLSSPLSATTEPSEDNISLPYPIDLTANANLNGWQLASSAGNFSQRLNGHYFILAEPGRHLATVLDIWGHPPELPDHPEKTDVIMRLWIDQTGKTIKIEPVTPELPQTFIENARNNLLNATFSLDRQPKDTSVMVIDVILRYSQAE